MSRLDSTTITTAIAKDDTIPAFLLEMAISADSPMTTMRAATWDTDIPWNGETWTASGILVKNISRTACTLEFPLGADDPWLAIIMDDGLRGREVSIYQHYTDETSSPQTDAVLIFTGIMDDVVLSDRARVSVQEKSRTITFPPESVEQPKFNYLLPSGTVITFDGKQILVR